jgi:hypothetical protein
MLTPSTELAHVDRGLYGATAHYGSETTIGLTANSNGDAASSLGAGYSFSDFSDDLTDLRYNHKGVILSILGTL